MNEMEAVQARIAARRQALLAMDDANYQPAVTKVSRPAKKKNRLLRLGSSMCLMLSLALGSLIYMRVDEEGKYLRKLNIDVNFAKVNAQIGSFLDNFLNFDLLKVHQGDVAVDASQIYTPVSANLYQAGSNRVQALSAGTVVSAGVINNVPTIIIAHDQGFLATYTNIDEVIVYPLDRVTTGADIGVSYDLVTIYFSIDGQQVSYEEILRRLS